jgi:Flp pilus assembly pilin Flp
MIRPSHPVRRAFVRHLIADRSGATLVEFAFVAPILIMMIMGIFDMAHTQYTSALLNGAMQKAGRDMTLENAGSQQANNDERVRQQVLTVLPAGAEVEFKRLSHFDFSDIGEPEEVIEPAPTANRRCDPGETYIDDNDNGRWDPDRGQVGNGGARDAVLFTAEVSYDRLFPMDQLIGLPGRVQLRATTVLRNQPFDEQDRSTDTRPC